MTSLPFEYSGFEATGAHWKINNIQQALVIGWQVTTCLYVTVVIDRWRRSAIAGYSTHLYPQVTQSSVDMYTYIVIVLTHYILT